MINIVKQIFKHNFTTLAGSLAFFIIINGGSLIFLILFVASFFSDYIPEYYLESNPFFSFFANNIPSFTAPSTILLVFSSIWSSSSLLFHLLNIGEIIYGVKKRPFKFFKRISAIITVFIIMLLIISILIILVALITLFHDYEWVSYLLFYIVFPCLIVFITHFVTIPRRLKFKSDYKGMLISLIYIIISSFVFVIFLNIFKNFKAIYGALSIIISFMFWIYLIAQGLISGIIFNKLISKNCM